MFMRTPIVGASGAVMDVRNLASRDLEGTYALRTQRYEEVARDPAYGMSTVASPPTRGEFALWFAQLHKSVLDGIGVCSVAEEDGSVVGMARIGPESDALETTHVGILSIEVLPEFRGRGVGTALLDYAVDHCRGVFEIVKIEVLPENVAGRRLYRKFGFEEYGRLPRGFYRAGAYHDFILMHRVISPGPDSSAPR